MALNPDAGAPVPVASTEMPLLDNIVGPLEAIGIAPLLNPLYLHISSQRLMMYSAHIQQTLIVNGCEFPLLFSGIEGILGKYEHDTTERSQNIEILAVIPKFVDINGPLSGSSNSPSYIIFYRGDADNKIGYFNYNLHTCRSDGYGYPNKPLNFSKLFVGNFIHKTEKLVTSPAHDGNKYCLGVNANVAFMDLPGVTEDAFIISERLAKKLETYSYNTISFQINSDQIPLDLYGNEEEYKFLPDLGERVGSDGILAVLRTLDENTMVYDTDPINLKKIQHLHDDKIYVEPNSEIIDIDIVINRKCKNRIPEHILGQVEKYRTAVNSRNLRIVELYNRMKQENREFTPACNTLITRAMEDLISDGVKIPENNRKYSFRVYKRKEAVEFIHITVTYRYIRPVQRGFKLTNRSGGKGTVAAIWPDDCMPVDEQGFQADLIKAAVSVFNRMNPSQWIEQFVNRGAEMRRQYVASMVAHNKSVEQYRAAFDALLEYATDCNYNWTKCLVELHKTDKDIKEYVDQVIAKGFNIWMPPGISGLDSAWIGRMEEKWKIGKSPVTFKIQSPTGKLTSVTTKKAVMVGPEYLYLLYKIPHLRSTNIAHINQYGGPSRPSAVAKMEYPIPQTANRLGEDEMRNITMTAGAETAERILCMYANSYDAVMNLGEHLLFDKVPSQLKDIDMSLTECIDTNNIVRLTQHMFGALGVNSHPDPAEITEILSDKDAINASEEIEDDSGEKISE